MYHYVECQNYLVVMLSDIMLSDIMLNVIVLSVILLSAIMQNIVMLSVTAPNFCAVLGVDPLGGAPIRDTMG